MQTLSFGTVMAVLQQCGNNVENKTNLTMAVINIAIPDSPYTIHEDLNYAKNFNSIYKCARNLQNMFNGGKPWHRVKPDRDVIKQFDETVVPLINNDKRRLAILALCDMIEKDCTLDSKNNGQNISRFETYIEKPIQEFLNDREYIFSEFLAKICLYTIFEVNNRSCEDWVKQLSEKYNGYEEGFGNYIADFENSKREFHILGTSSEKKKSQNTASQTIDNRATLTPPEEDKWGTSKEDPLGGETLKQYRERTNTAAVRDIGLENQICLCCENWMGDMKNAFKAPHGSVGTCTLKNEKILSTNSMCKWAIPSLNRANKHMGSIFDS